MNDRITELEEELRATRAELRRLRAELGELPWRTGRRVGRTVYDARGQLVGVLDTPELAAAVVEAVNAKAGVLPSED
jgi:hypothetical protein